MSIKNVLDTGDNGKILLSLHSTPRRKEASRDPEDRNTRSIATLSG